MRRHLVYLVILITLLACTGTPAPASPSPAASATSALPPAASVAPSAQTPAPGTRQVAQLTMDCLSGMQQATCDQAMPVVLATVAASGWTARHVWISSGALCPMADCLFDPGQMFPVVVPPSGGQLVGSAEIAFAETPKHAGLSLAAVGTDLVATLIGYRDPLLTWCSGSCPSSLVTDGRFRLELVLPHLDWTAQDAISGTAILYISGDLPITIYGSGAGVIAFSYQEIGGSGRHADWVMTADCGPHPLDPATPLNARLSKSGGTNGASPEEDAFMQAFLADPEIHLPAGTWDISAVAVFAEAAGCSSQTHTMTTTERITVSG